MVAFLHGKRQQNAAMFDSWVPSSFEVHLTQAAKPWPPVLDQLVILFAFNGFSMFRDISIDMVAFKQRCKVLSQALGCYWPLCWSYFQSRGQWLVPRQTNSTAIVQCSLFRRQWHQRSKKRRGICDVVIDEYIYILYIIYIIKLDRIYIIHFAQASRHI